MLGEYVLFIFTILCILYIIVHWSVTTLLLQNILQTDFLKEFGYIVYKNGKIVANNNKGQIRGLWAGGDVNDIDPLFKKFSKQLPGVNYILCRVDGLEFRETESNFQYQRNKSIFGLFDERMSRYDRSKFKFIFCSINYRSFEHLQNTHTFSNLLLLPTPFTQRYHQYPTKNNLGYASSSWYSKEDKAIWVGSMNGVFKACHSRVGSYCPRLHIYHASRDNDKIDFIFKNDSEYNNNRINEYKIDPKCVTVKDITVENQKQYKMILVIDGWGFPGGLFWVLNSGCLPIIISDCQIGITKNYLEPWVHYIPAQTDGSDINEHVQWVLDNPTQCVVILENLHKKLKIIDDPMFLQGELQREMTKNNIYP